jgi:hypothetical protein
MEARDRRARISCIVGGAAMLLGCLDPLEGSPVILFGTGLTALGAFLSANRLRKAAYWGVGLTALGVGTLFWLSSIGGLGGDTGRSMAWSILLLPYPVGAVMALVTDARMLMEFFPRRP